jgi:hypothetical protein
VLSATGIPYLGLRCPQRSLGAAQVFELLYLLAAHVLRCSGSMVTKKWLTRCRFGALVICGFGPLVAIEPSLAEPSLANLLKAPTPVDPVAQATDQLAAQLAEIERRAFAQATDVQRVLAEARAELSHARAAYAAGAPEQLVFGQLALVRAALSAADRSEARASAAAALARLKQQADEAEAAARAAEAALQQASSALEEPPP